jgi:hypothetical protein
MNIFDLKSSFILNVVSDTNLQLKNISIPLKLKASSVLTSPRRVSIEPLDKFGNYENL